ncbi:hypothetical protein MHB44_08610 [Lysinibacillus sp. FSL H8-0500]|uniref:hypothetical protein n=1 Tax=Lysinibacillus sp. FSL H8-0500 TaxID=2921393 RepID=UPI0031015E56
MLLNKDVCQSFLAKVQQLFTKHTKIATTTVEETIEVEVGKELDTSRQELLYKKKAKMFSASTEQKKQDKERK